jgi:hypothetical protein
MNIKNGLMAAAFAILAVVAVTGWTRKPSGQALQPAYLDQNGQPINGPASVATNSPQSGSSAVPWVPNSPYPTGTYSNRPTYQQALYSTPSPDDGYVSERYVRSIHRPVRIVRNQYVSSDSVVRDNGYASSSRGEIVTTHAGRSKGKSIAIVAGSAGAGAAIGALAGGGKGAGIGALAGGGAGFIYDRLTHNHR